MPLVLTNQSLRIFVGFNERNKKRNLFNITLGHVTESDTCCCGDISSSEVPLGTFWCGISPSYCCKLNKMLCLTIWDKPMQLSASSHM